MKAIFMKEIGGKLIEQERRDIRPTPVYYKAIYDPYAVRVLANGEIPNIPTAKRERWICVARPMNEKDPAFFVLEGIE
jgi:hypothetical protein